MPACPSRVPLVMSRRACGGSIGQWLATAWRSVVVIGNGGCVNITIPGWPANVRGVVTVGMVWCCEKFVVVLVCNDLSLFLLLY